MTIKAFYIHSWFSWIAFSLISNKLLIQKDQILLILARNFKVPEIEHRFQSIRFELTEAAINTTESLQEKHQAVDLFFQQSGINSPISELFIPHIAYEPFAMLAANKKTKFFNFYQESLQLPSDVLVRRESEYLLQNRPNSLYLTYDLNLKSKMTKKYYTLTNEIIPLHLIPVSVDGFVRKITSISSTNAKYFDFAIIAGKAQNHPLGIALFRQIISIYREFYPKSNILLKASPSSSRLVEDWMRSQESDKITFISGDMSIESWLVKDQIGIIFSELFSLSALAMCYSQKTKLISIDKTLLKDFPAYSDIITDRISIKSYYDATMKQLSFSQYLIASLLEIKG